MGPVRRVTAPSGTGLLARGGLGFVGTGAPAWASVCATAHPNWDGTPSTALSEALFYLSTPAVLVLIVLSALAARFRSQWGGLGVVCLWSALVAFTGFPDEAGRAAILEGCRGAPTVFIAIVVAICAALIVYTLPRQPD